MRFCLVSEAGVPEESVRLLREACQRRDIAFEVVTAKTFDFDPARRLHAGDLLYTAAVSLAAARAEQFLFAPGVATFYVADDGIYFAPRTPTLLAESAGVPMVVGRAYGIGVMLAESMPSLRSLADFEAIPPAPVIDTARRAVFALGLEFSGVDVLEDSAGKAWFLEANFPCYYPKAQLYGGSSLTSSDCGSGTPPRLPVPRRRLLSCV